MTSSAVWNFEYNSFVDLSEIREGFSYPTIQNRYSTFLEFDENNIIWFDWQKHSGTNLYFYYSLFNKNTKNFSNIEPHLISFETGPGENWYGQEYTLKTQQENLLIPYTLRTENFIGVFVTKTEGNYAAIVRTYYVIFNRNDKTIFSSGVLETHNLPLRNWYSTGIYMYIQGFVSYVVEKTGPNKTEIGSILADLDIPNRTSTVRFVATTLTLNEDGTLTQTSNTYLDASPQNQILTVLDKISSTPSGPVQVYIDIHKAPPESNYPYIAEPPAANFSINFQSKEIVIPYAFRVYENSTIVYQLLSHFTFSGFTEFNNILYSKNFLEEHADAIDSANPTHPLENLINRNYYFVDPVFQESRKKTINFWKQYGEDNTHVFVYSIGFFGFALDKVEDLEVFYTAKINKTTLQFSEIRKVYHDTSNNLFQSVVSHSYKKNYLPDRVDDYLLSNDYEKFNFFEYTIGVTSNYERIIQNPSPLERFTNRNIVAYRETSITESVCGLDSEVPNISKFHIPDTISSTNFYDQIKNLYNLNQISADGLWDFYGKSVALKDFLINPVAYYPNTNITSPLPPYIDPFFESDYRNRFNWMYLFLEVVNIHTGEIIPVQLTNEPVFLQYWPANFDIIPLSNNRFILTHLEYSGPFVYGGNTYGNQGVRYRYIQISSTNNVSVLAEGLLFPGTINWRPDSYNIQLLDETVDLIRITCTYVQFVPGVDGTDGIPIKEIIYINKNTNTIQQHQTIELPNVEGLENRLGDIVPADSYNFANHYPIKNMPSYYLLIGGLRWNKLVIYVYRLLETSPNNFSVQLIDSIYEDVPDVWGENLVIRQLNEFQFSTVTEYGRDGYGITTFGFTGSFLYHIANQNEYFEISAYHKHYGHELDGYLPHDPNVVQKFSNIISLFEVAGKKNLLLTPYAMLLKFDNTSSRFYGTYLIYNNSNWALYGNYSEDSNYIAFASSKTLYNQTTDTYTYPSFYVLIEKDFFFDCDEEAFAT